MVVRWHASAVAVMCVAACSGSRKEKRDDAAVNKLTAHDAAAGKDSKPAERDAAAMANAAKTGTVKVTVRWPKPPPAAFVALPSCVSDGEQAAVITTTRLVVGAVVEMDGTASANGRKSAQKQPLITLSDCALLPLATVVPVGGAPWLRRTGNQDVYVQLEDAAHVVANRVVQFPVIGHTVSLDGLAPGQYRLVGDGAGRSMRFGVVVVTANAAGVTDGDGILEFTAQPGEHTVTATLPAIGDRPGVTTTGKVTVVAGELATLDLAFGTP